MIETTRLYFENPYRVEFEASVLEKFVSEDKQALILDQTCFYPESGGQPSDRGTINEIEVVKVFEEEGRILHLLEKDISARKITGKIDWKTRFDHMQQHSGQHILSQSFYEIIGGETLSFHLGEASSTVEIGIEKVNEEEVEKVERRANEIVFQDREIKAYFIPEDQITDIPLRKPPKKEGLIRVIEVAKFDYSACGGTHCRRSGEIGLIKIRKWERIRNNIRFDFVCGQRALHDYLGKNRYLRQLASQLSVQEKDVFLSVQKLLSEMKSEKKRIKKLQERIAPLEAQEVIQKSKGKIIKEIFVDRALEEVKFLALNIIKSGEYVVLYGLKSEMKGHLVLACSESLNMDMRQILPIVIPLINGKGGGSASLVEIVTEDKESLELALDKACDYISLRL